MKKAIFLGVSKFHSNKKNADYRKVDLYTPPFKDSNGFMRGGVESIFTDLNSTVGEGIVVGAIVIPEYVYDHYSGRDNLVGLTPVKASPYSSADFAD